MVVVVVFFVEVESLLWALAAAAARSEAALEAETGLPLSLGVKTKPIRSSLLIRCSVMKLLSFRTYSRYCLLCDCNHSGSAGLLGKFVGTLQFPWSWWYADSSLYRSSHAASCDCQTKPMLLSNASRSSVSVEVVAAVAVVVDDDAVAEPGDDGAVTDEVVV